MVTNDEVRMIAEYVRLRDRLSELYREVTAVDQRLIELERLLPEEYVYPDDLPENRSRTTLRRAPQLSSSAPRNRPLGPIICIMGNDKCLI